MTTGTMEMSESTAVADPAEANDEGEAPIGERRGRDLIKASKPYQTEQRGMSWFVLLSTLGVLAALAAATVYAEHWYLRLPLAILQGLVIVRGFIIYHDYLHNALLRRSAVAKWIMYAYGTLVLTPPNVWRQTHNYHHAHTAKIIGSHVGSYLMVTTDMWEKMKPSERLMYRIIRHPLTILFGYFTLFLYGMCISSFLRNPKKNWDSLLAVAINLALSALIWGFFGFEIYFFTFFLPLFVSFASGGYLFYIQHNYPEMHVQERSEWEYTKAALESSSYMKTGPVMAWLTGNIGYHHVHHLNPGIPFYRLPEAMKGIPELQNPGTITLGVEDIVRSFTLKLWDPKEKKMVGYPQSFWDDFGIPG